MRFGLYPVPIALVCGSLILVGCGSSSSTSSAPSSDAAAAGLTRAVSVAAAPSAAVSKSPVRVTASASSKPVAPVTTAISIPPYLCDATDAAQNAADAYMGALSAGDERQASACVLPRTVPALTTRGLLATVKGTAVYLPRDGVDGPAVFGYKGNGKSIDVTVTKEPDGKFWVTKVSVRDA